MSKHKRSVRRAEAEAKADKSIWVPGQGDKIDFNLDIRSRNDLTPRQQELIDLIMDKNTKVVFIDGPAGTSKTFVAVYCGLLALQQRKVSTISYVRTIVESASKSLGSLPGDEKLKMEPFLIPLADKLEEFLPRPQKDRLLKDGFVKGLPVNYLRGASFNAQYIICDEAQNYTRKEMITAITRLGQFSKMIFIGDPTQSDVNGQSGFKAIAELFNDKESVDNGIHCFSFGKEDVVRSGILKFICGRIESAPKTK